MKKPVALIYGGEGREREISRLSAEGVYAAIDKEEYEVIPVYIDGDGCWYRTCGITGERGTPTYPVRLFGRSGIYTDGEITPLYAAVIALHGDAGEDGVIQGALDAAHIRYVGCDSPACAVCCDKIYAKAIAESAGIPTARWIYTDGSETCEAAVTRCEAKLGYPVFVKPARLGSSIGIYTAEAKDELCGAIKSAHRFSDRLLIEERIDVAYEIECGVLYDRGAAHISPSGAVYTDGDFYSYDKKYSAEASPRTAHGQTPDRKICDRIRDYTARLCRLVGTRGLSRFDYFVTRDGDVLFNEVNTFPGMTATSLFPRITEDMGYRRDEYINILLRDAAL